MAQPKGFHLLKVYHLLEKVFGCPVAMEYGSVETQVVAHTHPDGFYHTFWQTYFLDIVDGNDERALQVTSLYERCFPLIRYQLGDEIELIDGAPIKYGIQKFQRVIGRCNDWVELADGFKAHSEIFSHAVRGCSKINQFQVMVSGKDLSIHYLSKIPLTEEEKKDILSRFEKIHPMLGAILLHRVEKLEQSIAGKTPMIYRV